MEKKDLSPFQNKIVAFTFRDEIDGEIFRKGKLISISDSAITIQHYGGLQVFNLNGILRIREVG